MKNKKKKILVIDPVDFVGGAELFNIDFLKKVNLDKFEVVLLTSGQEDYLKKLKKVSVKVLKFKFGRMKKWRFKALKNLWQAVKMVKRTVKEEKIDLIHTNSIRAHIVGAVAAFLTRKKLIWVIHDFTFPKFFVRRLIRVPQKILISSEAVKKFTENQVPKKYWSKLVLVPNGVDLEKIEKMAFKATLREELNLGPKVKLVGMVGRIDWWKGQDSFIRAAAKVLAKLPQTRFLIVGEASEHDEKTAQFKKKLEELQRDFDLGREVYFMGFKPNVWNVIKEFDVLVHASTEPEPFGRVVLEGMAVGTPVVASNLGGPKEIIIHKFNGLLVNPKDIDEMVRAIASVLENKDLAEKLKENGVRTIKRKYTLGKVVRSIEQVYERVLGE